MLQLNAVRLGINSPSTAETRVIRFNRGYGSFRRVHLVLVNESERDFIFSKLKNSGPDLGELSFHLSDDDGRNWVIARRHQQEDVFLEGQVISPKEARDFLHVDPEATTILPSLFFCEERQHDLVPEDHVSRHSEPFGKSVATLRAELGSYFRDIDAISQDFKVLDQLQSLITKVGILNQWKKSLIIPEHNELQEFENYLLQIRTLDGLAYHLHHLKLIRSRSLSHHERFGKLEEIYEGFYHCLNEKKKDSNVAALDHDKLKKAMRARSQTLALQEQKTFHLKTLRKYLKKWRDISRSQKNTSLDQPSIVMSEAQAALSFREDKIRQLKNLHNYSSDSMTINRLTTYAEIQMNSCRHKWESLCDSFGINLDLNSENTLDLINKTRLLVKINQIFQPSQEPKPAVTPFTIVSGWEKDYFENERKFLETYKDTLPVLLTAERSVFDGLASKGAACGFDAKQIHKADEVSAPQALSAQALSELHRLARPSFSS